MEEQMTKCTRCVMDQQIDPNLTIDKVTGQCNWCDWQDGMQRKYWLDGGHRDELNRILAEIRSTGEGKQYDCVIGASGGVDSSYLIHKAVVDWGLRPLVVNFDDGWDIPEAATNLNKIIRKLDLQEVEYELISGVTKSGIINEMYRSTLEAGVIDTDAPTDIMMMKAIHEATLDNDVGYLLDAHNYQSEATTPTGTAYFDGRYVIDMYERYTGKKATPYMWKMVVSMRDQIEYLRAGLKKPRLLYYLNYKQEDAKELLKREYGWESYPLKHGENKWTTFSNYYWWPKRFGFDFRKIYYSALIRSGQMTREDATKQLEKDLSETEYVKNVVDEVRYRLGLVEDRDWTRIMTQPTRTYKDFKTYKTTFRWTWPIWWVAMKQGMVPKSFYDKYCGK